MLGTGFQVGLHSLTGLDFRADKPHTACKICGAVFQSNSDRALPVGVLEGHAVWAAESIRRKWSHNHAKYHSQHEHESLKKSGRFCTPEAAVKLVPYGIIPFGDAVLDPEIEDALRISKPVPFNDSEE